MKKIIILILAIANIATAQTLQKSLNFQVNSNDLEILKLIVSDYNQRIVQTNIEYKFLTNNVVVTNVSTMIVPVIKDNTTNFVEQPVKMLSTNLETQTITNIAVVTNGVWYSNAEQFYQEKILPLVNTYHTELIKTTLRDYYRSQVQQATNEAEKLVIYDKLKKYE